MAVELDLDDDIGSNDDEQGGAPGTAGSSSGGAAAPGGPGMGSRPATPSGRPNVQQYLNANQGAGEKLATNVTKSVKGQANQLNQGVDQTLDQLNTSAKPLEEELGVAGKAFGEFAFKNPASILNSMGQLPQLPKEVTSYVRPSEDKNLVDAAGALNKFRRLQNQGAKDDIKGINDKVTEQQAGLQNDYNKVAERANQANSETGRFELLRSSLGQPNYNRGAQKLDQLFLQSQPGVNRTLQNNLKGIQNQANQKVTGLETERQAKINALQGFSADRAAEIKKMISGGVSDGLEADINDRGLGDIALSNKQQKESAQAEVDKVPALRERLKTLNLTTQDLSNLGLNTGDNLYDIDDLSSFINQSDPASITAASVADPKEFARYRALQQLAGDTTEDIFGGATQAGGFKPYQMNKPLSEVLSERKKYYEEELLNRNINKYFGAPGSEADNYVTPRAWGSDFSLSAGNGLGIGGPTVSFGASDEARGIQDQTRREIANAKNAEELQRALDGFTTRQRERYGVGLDGDTPVSWDSDYNYNLDWMGFRGLDTYIKDLKQKRGRTINALPGQNTGGPIDWSQITPPAPGKYLEPTDDAYNDLIKDKK